MGFSGSIFVMRMRLVLMLSLAFAVLLIVCLQLTLPGMGKKWVINSIKDSCETCVLEIDDVKLGLFPFSVSLNEVHLQLGDPLSTGYRVDLQKIFARVSLQKLLQRELLIKKIEFHSPDVLVTEGDADSPPNKNEGESSSRWKFLIEETEVLNGKFKYQRVYHRGSSIVQVKNIHVKASIFGNLPSLKDKPIKTETHAQLEDSGNVTLKVDALPFSQELNMDINLQLANQNLNDLNPFFYVSDGIKLSGRITSSNSFIHLRNQTLTGSVRVKYHGFDIVFKKTKERTQLSAFFSNLLKKFKLNSDNLKRKKSDQKKFIELQRQPKETVISFIFRGLKEGALEVATD